MAITQTRRKYLTPTEYTDFNGGSAPTLEQINLAEELIDSYVGYQSKAMNDEIIGRVASATASSFVLEAGRHQGAFQNDFFTNCEVQIVKGTGSGQHRTISASVIAGTVTVDDAFDTTPDSTSYYKLFQPGKFPRDQDYYFDGQVSPQVYIKTVPELVKRAVAAQVQFIIQMGDAYFNSTASNFQQERIGDYMYNQGIGTAGNTSPLISPKAKQLLKGYVNRKGRMILGS